MAMNVLGIMSGTSLDGVDYALCHVARGSLRLVRHWQVRFPAGLRGQLDAAVRGCGTSHELARLHHALGRFYARHALRGLTTRDPADRVDLIGLHGQTVFHDPSPQTRATLQIGEPAWLAQALRAPVVSNFRAADLATGGQGAPLATAFHVVTFGRRGRHVCVNNLGGISNVTSIDWRHGPTPRVLAFDTGPANMLIDLAARHFSCGRLKMDRNGRLARRGQPSDTLLRRWLRHRFFRRPPPKSTGRELFGEPWFERVLRAAKEFQLSPADVLATLTEFTARSLASNYRWHLPAPADEVILTGGGAANPVLVRAIKRTVQEIWPKAQVRSARDLGWPLQAIEPAAFAWLAWLRWRGRPGNLPETTGAARPVLLGQITEP